MKTLSTTFIALFAIILLSSSHFTTSQNLKAEVEPQDGIHYFITCDPVQQYEVVFVINQGMIWNNSQINSIGKIKQQLKWRADKQGIPYDALYLNDKNVAAAIKFID